MAATADSPRREPSSPDGLWLALRLDGRGGAEEIDWDALVDAASEKASVWVHLDARCVELKSRLCEDLGIAAAHVDALFRSERRSAIEPLRGGGLAVSVYGLEPERGWQDAEVASLRMLIERRRVVSVSTRPLRIVDLGRSAYATGRGPETVADLVLWMAAHLGEALDGAAMHLEAPMADLEFEVDKAPAVRSAHVRDIITEITRVRRHVAPFQILVSRLARTQELTWLVGESRGDWQRLSDQADDTASVLQGLLDRARALADDIAERLAERTNHILYVLTVVSSVTLPLSLFVGFLGMNIGTVNSNILGLDRPIHVALVLVVLCLLAVGAYSLIRLFSVEVTRRKLGPKADAER
jgi:zinc transporter